MRESQMGPHAILPAECKQYRQQPCELTHLPACVAMETDTQWKLGEDTYDIPTYSVAQHTNPKRGWGLGANSLKCQTCNRQSLK